MGKTAHYGVLTVLLCALLLAACSSGPSTRRPRVSDDVVEVSSRSSATHRVRRGDTLYAIARTHRMGYKELARMNGIAAPYRIYPGQVLRLSKTSARPSRPARPGRTSARVSAAPKPPAATVKPVKPSPSPQASTSPKPATAVPKPTAASPKPVSATARGSWQWPTDGKVLRTFAANDPARQGLKIGGLAGQPVRAAKSGEVVYSGSGLVGYGELVIVKHSGGYLTAYGHNRKRLVAEGDRVERGQVIAELGRSGTDREMLHFEIRLAGKPTNPIPLLPKR